MEPGVKVPLLVQFPRRYKLPSNVKLEPLPILILPFRYLGKLSVTLLNVTLVLLVIEKFQGIPCCADPLLATFLNQPTPPSVPVYNLYVDPVLIFNVEPDA